MKFAFTWKLCHFCYPFATPLTVNGPLICDFIHCSITDIDECASQPCMNNATCAEYIGFYNCSCLPGYNETNCETGTVKHVIYDHCFRWPLAHGCHRDWKTGETWENGMAFSSQGKVREFCQDWKSQGILLKILEKSEKIILENLK